MEAYVAPYVQVRHAIHLLYATSPYSRDGRELGDPETWDSVNDRRVRSHKRVDGSRGLELRWPR